MNLKDLQEKYRTLLGRAESESDATTRAALVTELKSARAEIEQAQELGELKRWGEDPATGQRVPLTGAKTYETGVKAEGWTEAGESEGILSPKQLASISTKAYADAFQSYIRSSTGLRDMSASALKVLQEGSDTGGGFLVPVDVLNKLVAKEPTPTQVSGRVTSLQTSRDALTMPKTNYTTDNLYTTGIRVTWTGEVPSSSTVHRVTEPVFGQLRIPVHTAMMSMSLTNDMVEDAAFPIVGWSSGKFSETIDLLRDNMILNGSGIGQPEGILANPGTDPQPSVVTSGSAATFTADKLIAVCFSLPPQYDRNAAWVMSKTSGLLTVAQLKDGQGRYLLGSGLQDSGISTPNGISPSLQTPTIKGYGVLVSEFMPAVGANNYSAIFGDLSGYYMVNRTGFSVQVLRELYAETNQILLLGRLRFGGQVAEPWKLIVHQCAA